MNLASGLFPFSIIRYKTILQISLCNGTPIGHTGLLPQNLGYAKRKFWEACYVMK